LWSFRSLFAFSAQWLYEKVYCQRGDIENRIKELHELHIGRTSCSRFWANQFRVLLTAAAYVRCRSCACEPPAPTGLAPRFERSANGCWNLVPEWPSPRRMVLHLPASFPFLADFRKVAMALGTSTG
jgi:hypothetical protein